MSSPTEAEADAANGPAAHAADGPAAHAADGIAVIGMACVFPGARDLDAFWANVRDGVDAITDVPAARWDPVFYDPLVDAVDRFYCRRGGFVDGLLDFDALGFGVMPVAARGAEPDQLAALQVASQALADAGYAAGAADGGPGRAEGGRPLPRERTGVVIGRGNYIGAGMTRLEQHVRTAEQLVSALRELVPGLGEDRLAAVKAEFQSRLGGYGPDTAIGLVPNLTASRIANRLDLGGSAYTLDAACASALLAVDRACADLYSGQLDLALAGGVHLSHDVAFWSVFTQLGALSRSQRIRPFDRRADGLLIGEGLGLLVLKRRAEAERDGDRIYAVIRGTGVASDGRGATILTPSVGGQRLALQRAWANRGIDPARIGLVEAHGTGTPVGDAAEVATLRDFFGPAGDGPRAVLGSVKSMIGHTMPAAGAAGLIKAILAIHHRVLPPTLHCEEPLPALLDTRFRTLDRAEPWSGAGPRVAAVNAFGFGGINAHVVLEGRDEGAPRRARAPAGEEGLLWLARPDMQALGRALDEGAPGGGEGPCRLALVDPSPARRVRARAAVAQGEARRGRDGLWLSPRGMLARGGKVAFLFPGVEAQVPPRLPDVARHLGRTLPPEVDGTALERQGAIVVENGRLLAEALAGLGVQPDLVAGHSTGEWTGMMAVGLIPPGELDAFLATLDPGSLEVPGVTFLSVGAGLDKVAPLVADLDGVVVTHDNCPHQVVLCGEAGAIARARERLLSARVLHGELPFRSGFHAPFFEPYLVHHRQRLATMPLGPARMPLWSATTCAPYPRDLDRVRELVGLHLVRPVRFRELIEALYTEGARVFVQVGMGSLVGFVADTLKGREHLVLSAQEPQRAGLAQLRRVAAALFVEGLDIDLTRLDPPRPAAPRPPLALDLGVPLVHLATPLDLAAPPAPPSPATDPVLAGFDALVREVEQTRAALQAAWSERAAPSPAAPSPATPHLRVSTRRLSVADCPFLVDHSLIPQPPGWPVIADGNPVVPMTMSLRMMLEAATAAAPGRVAIGLEQVRAHRWLAVEPPVQATLRAEPAGRDRVKVTIEGYSEGTVVLAPAWPAAPAAAPAALADEGPVGLTAAALYDERWMFHGPGYQAVARLDAIGSDGIRGQLVALPAEGALLDAAGQLFGYWVMARVEHDKLAMPVKIDRVELFGPEPAPGERLDCVVRIRQLGAREVRADLELSRHGRTWCRITGWTDWRFEVDARLWAVMQRTEHHLFAERRDDGLCIVDDPGRSASSRDYLSRRFLGAAERATLDALPPRDRVPWLLGRIAAKDAVRGTLWQHGAPPLFPVELSVLDLPGGRVQVQGPDTQDLRVDLATFGTLAAALAVRGRDPGVAISPVPPGGDALADPTPEARLHAARAALARARGEPQPGVLSEVQGERLCIDGVWVDTERRGDAIIAWTTT